MTDFVLKTHLSKNQEVESRLTASEDVFVVSLSHYNKRDTTLHSTKRKKVAYNRSCSDFPLLTERVQLIVSVTVFGFLLVVPFTVLLYFETASQSKFQNHHGRWW